MDNLLGLINRLGMARLAAMAVVAVLLLGFFAFLTFRFTAPQMAPLYSGLTFDDSVAIVSELRAMNVPFELRGDGETILVARDQITTLRMSLAEDGLPTRGQVGYEIFDQQNTLGATSFVQNINQVRALEGELARTISSLARIRTARVHLVLPERVLFRQDRQEPSASIMLGVRGELSAGEIRAIQHLVASAIEGLNPNRVSIVDDSGRLLASGAATGNAVIAGEFEERTLGIETRLRTRIEDLLSNVVGPGRARVQVAAEIDLNRLTRTSETFDPDGQVVRSTQSREAADSATNAANGGAVTVADELPGAQGGGANGVGNQQSSTTEETVNYEISRVTETQISEAGGIKRLSVAVAVDGSYAADGNGGATYTPRTATELAQLTALVRSAVGFDEARGDRVEVVNLQFAARPEALGPGTSDVGLFDFTRDDLMNAANMGVTLLIALALLLFVLRPLLRRALEPEAEPLALAPSAEVSATAGESAQQPAVPQKPQWMDKARIEGEAQMQTVRDVGALIQENPKQATVIVRDWLGQAA